MAVPYTAYRNLGRVERLLDEIEAALVPPPRRRRMVFEIVHRSEEERAAAEAKTLAENGGWVRNTEIVHRILEPAEVLAYGIALHTKQAAVDTRERAAEGQAVEQQRSEAACEPAPVETLAPSETLPDVPEPSDDVAETDPSAWAANVVKMPARSKPWRPVHQRPARDQRRPTWKEWER